MHQPWLRTGIGRLKQEPSQIQDTWEAKAKNGWTWIAFLAGLRSKTKYNFHKEEDL